MKLKKNCQLGVPRKLRVVVRGSEVKVFVDGKQVLQSAYCLEKDTGRVGLAASGCVARFDDFCVRRLPATPRLSSMPLKPCEIVAHRGFSRVAPENTLASIAGAIRAGATGSETPVENYLAEFNEAVADDLNMPRALAAMWGVLKDAQASDGKIYATLLAMDAVLGFGFETMQAEQLAISEEQIQALLDERTAARAGEDYARADAIRDELADKGIEIMDSPAGTTWRRA